MATTESWDYFNKNVQSGLVEGRYLNASFTLIAAGPPRLAAIGSKSTATDFAASGDADAALKEDIAYPIGIIQSFNLGQNTQIMRLFEIGSERSYFIRGRTMGQLGLGRIMYHGPSLLRVLYAYMSDKGGKFDSLYDASGQRAQLNTSSQDMATNAAGVQNLPGHDNLWLDLASDVFSQPVGLMLVMRDSNSDTVGAFYFEYCMITNHGFATDSGGTIMTENAAIMYERIVPIDIGAVPIIRNSDDIVGGSGSVISGDPIGSAT